MPPNIKVSTIFKDSIPSIVAAGIVAIVSLPIILFVLINTFNIAQINLPFVTIPKLEVNRFKEITSIFSGEFINTSLSNFLESLKIITWQTDGLSWNSIEPFGIIYKFSLVFTVLVCVISFRKKEKIHIKYNYIFNIWFIVSIVLSFICEPNINRLNIIVIPIIYYTIVGIYAIIDSKEKLMIWIAILYLISFSLFLYTYINQDWSGYSTFENNLEDVITYVDDIDNKQIYITNKIKEPYIYVLFYAKYNTENFVETVEYHDENVEFRQVKKFGKYNFEDVENMVIDKNRVLVVKKQETDKINLLAEEVEIKEFNEYLVIKMK